MPKITVHGGASNRFEPQPPQPRPGEGMFFRPPAVDTAPALVEAEPEAAPPTDEGGEPSPGTSSSPSQPPTEKKPASRASKAQSPAPTTAPRSSRRPTAADGTAPSTATSGPETDGEPSANPPE